MIAEAFGQPATAWLITWLLHSTLLLGAVWAATRALPKAAPRLRAYVWHVAIVASLVSATAATLGAPGAAPIRLHIDEPAPVATPLAGSAVTDLWQSDTRIRDLAAGATAESLGAPPAAVREPRPSANQVLIAIWALVAVALLMRFVFTWHQGVTGLGPRAGVPSDHRAQRLLRKLAARADARTPALTCSAWPAGPVSLPGNEVCLPGWVLDELSDEQLEAVLAHELAHCLRHDPVVMLLIDALRRVLFFQPLLHVAQRDLAVLAELTADEVAAELTGDRRAVAQSLTECAGRVAGQPALFGAAMASRPSAFADRIHRLLQPGDCAQGAPGWRLRAAATTVVLAVALALPGFDVAADDPRAPRPHSSTKVLTDDDGTLSVIDLSIRNERGHLKVKGNGGFVLTDDETDLARLDADARLTIEEQTGGVKHKIRFDEDGGRIERQYWRNGVRQDLDATARTWLGEALPRLMRETGINAEQRAARLHRLGGAARLLDDIALIESDYPARLYITWLVENDDLDDGQYTRLLAAAGDIASDFESRQTLMAIAQHEAMDDRRAAGLLEVGADIASDYELRVLVSHLIAVSHIERLVPERLIEVIATIESDYEMREALSAMLADSDVPAAALVELLAVAGRDIGSDYELRVLLTQTAPRLGDHEALPLAYIDALSAIGSSFERRQALATFAQHAGGHPKAWEAALRAAADIDSDHECAEALIALAGRMPATDSHRRLYRDAMKTLGSHERERARRALDGGA